MCIMTGKNHDISGKRIAVLPATQSAFGDEAYKWSISVTSLANIPFFITSHYEHFARGENYIFDWGKYELTFPHPGPGLSLSAVHKYQEREEGWREKEGKEGGRGGI